MNKKKTLLILILVFVLLLGGAYFLYSQLGQDYAPDQLATQVPTEPESTESQTEETAETQEEPVMAPDFTVYDTEGNPVNLDDYTGKPIIVNFWASWCGPCQMEMPDFHKKYMELGELGVYSSTALELEQGENLYLKLSASGGEFSLGIFEPSQTALGIPVLTDLWLGNCSGSVYLLAETPYDTDCEYGIEYGLTQETTVLKTKTIHTDSESIFKYLSFDLVTEQPWHMRAYVKNLETGEVQYGQWETVQPKKGVQTDLSNGEVVSLQAPRGYYYYLFTAPETG